MDDPHEAAQRLATELPPAVGPMFRLLRRAVAVGYEHPRLPDAQVDLLRLVQRRPGIGVGEAAAELQLAPNTVSTLARELASNGLVARRQGVSDRRTGALHLTPTARHRLADWGEHRQRVLTELLGGLSDADRSALCAALPALERFRDALAARAAAGSGTGYGSEL